LAGYLHYTADGTGGNIVWSIAIERIGDNYQNIDTDSFGAETTITSGAPSASGDVLICNTSVLNLDGMVVGDAFRLRITREGTNENDTCEATAQFLAIELREI
jgi:hypothetical protein